MRKPAFCICENKDTDQLRGYDQLRGNREADQQLCFCYMDSTIPLLSKSEISSLYPFSVVAQPGLCRTWSEIPKNRFSHNEAHITTWAYLREMHGVVFNCKQIRVFSRCQSRSFMYKFVPDLADLRMGSFQYLQKNVHKAQANRHGSCSGTVCCGK